MWEPLFPRAVTSGPPVDPWTNRSVAALHSFSAPGTFIPTDVAADSACIPRDAGPNQPRYAFTSRSLGESRGSVKCSELPTEMPDNSFERTGKLRTRFA